MRSDAPILAAGLEALSDASRITRFLGGGMKTLTPEQLDYLCGCHDDRFAWGLAGLVPQRGTKTAPLV